MEDSLISQIGVIFGTLLGIALILYLAYISTKLLGKKFSFKNGSGRKLKILDSVSVGQGKMLIIVQAGEKTFLVGAASESINLISELDSSDFEEDETPPESGMDFKTAFKKVLENNFGKKSNKGKENENDSGQTK
ncbi:MAG: flagellar biosynthetic protein FliO [Oscillospiraceae bacterium]|nr:flagellar biosynthetic protein FliO [Oscillospiraceae bacterium]